MTPKERTKLENEWKKLRKRLEEAKFSNPKDMRRKDEITSLLMTDGENANIKFNFLKGRGGKMGMNIKKGYYNHGPVR